MTPPLNSGTPKFWDFRKAGANSGTPKQGANNGTPGCFLAPAAFGGQKKTLFLTHICIISKGKTMPKPQNFLVCGAKVEYL